MYALVVERKYDPKKRFFGLCESCYWTATILREVEHYECPVCYKKEISLIPIGNDENYEYSLEPKQGLQIKLSLSCKGIIR